jgi:hypothetical protein
LKTELVFFINIFQSTAFAHHFGLNSPLMLAQAIRLRNLVNACILVTFQLHGIKRIKPVSIRTVKPDKAAI